MRHIKSFEHFLEDLIDQFSYEDFSPENAGKISALFQKAFSIDNPYWKESTPISAHEEELQIEFKKYGTNRKKVELIFSLKPTRLTLTLCENSNDNKSTELSLCDIWLDHSNLLIKLKEIMLEGLKKTQECNK